MEFLLPHLDEFILDFDAEEALLQAQVLAAGQMQAQASILGGPGLGPYPGRHNQSLPNAAVKARGRQPQQAVSGVPAAAVEPVQLDSQLDALRREIARLEQQKQKQVATKAVPARPVSSNSAAARGTQKGANLPSSAKPPGTAIDSGAARQSSCDVQRLAAVKRARVGPSLAPAAVKLPADASRPDTSSTAGAGTGTPAPGATGPGPASPAQTAAATAGVAAQKQVGSKRSADDASGGFTAQQQSFRPRQQQSQPQRRPQQLSSEPQHQDMVREAAGVGRAQPAIHPSLPAAALPPPLSCQGNPHRNASGNYAAGSGQEQTTSGQVVVQQPKGRSAGSLLPTAQKPPSQVGPGAPRRQPQPRGTGQRPAASTSSPSATGGSLGSEHNAAATAAVPTIQPAAAPNGAANAAAVRVSSTSAAGGSPTKSVGNGKKARSAAGGSDGAPDEGGPSEQEVAAGSRDAGIAAGGSANSAQYAGRRATAPNGGIVDICPEAQLAANEFLVSFMNQIGGEEQGGATSAVATITPQGEDVGTSAGAQDQGQQQPEQGQHPKPRSGHPEGVCSGLRERTGGGASARRAAAERTSAAVQRLRRKSSGVAGTELLLRTMTSTGTAANGAAPATSVAASDAIPAADRSHPNARACATSPTYADGMLGGMAGLATNDPQFGGRNGLELAVAHTHTVILSTAGPQGHQAGLNVGGAPMAQTAAADAECAPATVAEAETEAQGLLGAVSSPVAPQALWIGLRGNSPGHGMPPLPGAAGPDKAALASGGCPGLQAVLQEQLYQGQQPPRLFDWPLATSGAPNAAGIMGLGAAMGVSAPRSSMPAADTLTRSASAAAGTATAAANVLPPLLMSMPAPHPLGSAALPAHPGAPSGMLPSAAASQFPYPQLPYGLGPRPLPGGSFPGAFLPGLPPGMQWRPSQPCGVLLGAGQPPVSLVEVDVLARKELILLKWQMLQEIAVDLEAEWAEVCLAHNRLRMLSFAQVQSSRSAVTAAPAGDPPGSADAPQTSSPSRPEVAIPVLHQHPTIRDHATFYPPTQLSYQQLQLPLQRPELQTGEHQGQSKHQCALGQGAPLQPTAPGQPLNVRLAAPQPMALQDVHGGRFLAAAPAEVLTAALQNGPRDKHPNGARHDIAPAEVQGAPDPAQLHLGSVQRGGQWPFPSSQFQISDKQSGHSDPREQEPVRGLVVQPRALEWEHGSEPAPRMEGERGTNDGPGPAPGRGPQLADWDSSTAPRNSPTVEQHPHGGHVTAVQQHDATAPRSLVDGAPATSARRMKIHGDRRPSIGDPTATLAAQQPWLMAAAPRSPPAGASLAFTTGVSANGPAARMEKTAAPQVGDRQPRLVERLAGTSTCTASAGVGHTGADGPQQQSRQHAGGQQQQQQQPQATHRSDTGRPCDGAAALRPGGEHRVNQAVLATSAEGQGAVTTIAYGEAARGTGQAMLSGPERHPPALTRSGSGDRGTTVGGGGGGPGPSPEQRTNLWMPWEDAGAPEAAPGPGEGNGEARRNVVGGVGQSTAAAATHSGGGATAGWGDSGQGDNGRSVGVMSEGSPFTGLSFKLSAAPIAGRRIAAMRTQLGTLSPPSSKSAALTGPKRASPSLCAVVPAPIVQPRGRSPAVAAGSVAGIPAPASAAPVLAASFPAAVAASPVEPPVRMQSAPQVLPATRPSGGSPGGAIAAAMPRQEQQAPHVPASGSAAAREKIAPRPGSLQLQPGPQVPSQPGQDTHQPSAPASIQISSPQLQQAAVCPQLFSPNGASVPPLYHRRLDIVLTERGAFGTTEVTTALDLLARKYMSPLNIFRSYSGGAPR